MTRVHESFSLWPARRVFRTRIGLLLWPLRPGEGDVEQGKDDPLDLGELVENQTARGVGDREAVERGKGRTGGRFGSPALGQDAGQRHAVPERTGRLRAVPGAPGPNGYFEYTLSPGIGTSGAVVVHDLTASPARYLVYVTGVTTSPTSGVAYGQLEAHPLSTAAWVQLSTGPVQLSAKGDVTVHFTVAVPGATPPGDYVTGLVAQTPTPTATVPASSIKGGCACSPRRR